MEENENTIVELSEEQGNEWDNAWDDAELNPDADENAETDAEEGKPEEAENADPQDGDNEGTETENTETENESEETDQFELKRFGEVTKVNRDEVITLAQKGMDYDRIRGKFDELTTENTDLKAKLAEAEGTLEHFKGLAESSGITLDELVINALASQRAAKNGTSFDAEIPNVKLELERKAFEKEKSDWETSKGTENTEADGDERMRKDLAQFAEEFPEAAKDVNSVPKEVWDEVNKGATLTSAYRNYVAKQKDAEIEALKAQLNTAKQNEKNKSRATGSQSTGSTGTSEDMWDAAWNDE